MRRAFALLLPLALLAGAARAQAPEGEGEGEGMTPEQFEATLNYQTGTVTIKDGLATLNLGQGFRYLGPDDAQRLLVDAWGNPPGEKPLGMIVPAASPLSEEGWGVIISYQEDGYVKDDEAAKIDYDALLQEMQTGTREENAARTEAGYPAIELVGWAARPRYDAAAHKLFWAKELKFGAFPENTLNYDVRVLGRRGVLSLNAVAAMSQLPAIERDMQQVLGFVEFNAGHRYGDYVRGDKVAAYGIGALVAGKVAAKAGLLKILLGALVVLKKGAVVLVLAALAFAKRLFGGKKEEPGPAAG
jgi:uncharacterized membrane-anchored protein